MKIACPWIPLTLTAISLVLTSCASKSTYNEFVQTINFTGLDHYTIAEVVVEGNDLNEADVTILQKASTDTLTVAMEARDFSAANPGDFTWQIHWEKKATFNPSALESIDPFREELNRRDEPSQRFARRWHLRLEAYLPNNPAPFWVKQLDNLFDAIELNEERVIASLERAIKNFPVRVEKNPNLPDIE